jgi:two-component system phosphate regulon sensor histidine kinase PhoR
MVRRPMFLFYVMAFYIFASYIWWTFLLSEKNNEVFKEQTELMKVQYIHSNRSFTELLQSPEYHKIVEKNRAQNWMVVSESMVFMLLILIGAIQLHKGFMREVNFNQQQKNFLLSITHELRSPMASAKVTLQTLQKHEQLPPDKYHRLIHNGLDDLERLQTLVENLLLATKIEDHSFKLGTEHCDLSAIVKQVLNKYAEIYQAEKNIESSIADNIYVIGDKMGLQSVITNLVENALKYSPAKSTIRVKLFEEGRKVQFSVADEGVGIPEKERSKIFKKFYRVGNEDMRRTKGTGLGLYIVAKVLALHKGKVFVKDNSPTGSVFEVELPKG